jgi:hypothetical protein
MARRRSSGYVTVDAEVDVSVDEVLDKLTDEDLIEEVRTRKLHLGTTAFSCAQMREHLEDIAFEMRRQRPDDAARMVDDLIEQMLRLERKTAYAEQRGAMPVPSATTATGAPS